MFRKESKGKHDYDRERIKSQIKDPKGTSNNTKTHKDLKSKKYALDEINNRLDNEVKKNP